MTRTKKTKGSKPSPKAKSAPKKELNSRQLEIQSEESAALASEQEENEDMALSQSIGGSAAAGLDATKSAMAETSSTLKNFRHHPDMENFYRFIYENDLRYEALDVIDQILVSKKEIAKGVKTAKAKLN